MVKLTPRTWQRRLLQNNLRERLEIARANSQHKVLNALFAEAIEGRVEAARMMLRQLSSGGR